MPLIDYDVTQAKESVFDRDKFNPEKGDACRILLLSHGAVFKWAHWVRNGKVIETGSRAGEQGGDYMQCLGDNATMMKAGRDDEHCPLCAIAEPGRDNHVSFATRRFAAIIVQYFTDKKGNLVDPRAPAIALKTWRFGDPVYTQLAKLAKEFGELWKRDLVVSVGTDQYKKQTITPGNSCVIMTPSENKGADGKPKAKFPNAVLALRSAQKDVEEHLPNSDLELLCGKPMSYEALEREAQGAVPKEIRENDFEASADTPDLDAMIDGTESALPSTVAESDLSDEEPNEEETEVSMDELINEAATA